MRILPGWRLRAKQQERGQTPAFQAGISKAEMWGELGHAESYLTAVEKYTTSDLVYMCVKRLEDMAADSQLVLYERDAKRNPSTGLPVDESKIEPGDHPFYDLWRTPNPWDSRAEMLGKIVITLLLSPQGVFINLDDGNREATTANRRMVTLQSEPVNLWWLLPEAMTVKPGADSFIEKYIHKIAGETTEFEPSAIMRIVEFNPINQYLSLSRLQPLDLATNTDIAGQRTNWAMFKNGFRPSAIIESDRDMVDPAELKLMEKLWTEKYTGADNWHKFFPLWAGFKIAEYGISPREAEFTEAVALNRFRVFGVFGVHPGLILSEDVNLANAKVAEHATRKHTLKPLLRRVADEITDILPLWSDAPPAEAHFVGVVPEDKREEYDAERVRAWGASFRANAINTLVNSVGAESATEIARKWEIIPPDIDIEEAEMPPEIKAIQPVLPPVPLEPERITEADIDRALAEFYNEFPELDGILQAESSEVRNGTS